MGRPAGIAELWPQQSDESSLRRSHRYYLTRLFSVYLSMPSTVCIYHPRRASR